MDHKLNIKFGEVNNLSDARYAAGAGATFLGFNLSTSHPQYIAPEKIKEICGWVSGPIPVAEWGNEPASIISDTCNSLGMEYIQLNAFNPEITAALKMDFCVIQNIEIGAEDHLAGLIEKVNKVNGLAMYYMLSFKDLSSQEMFLSKESHCLMVKDFCRDQPIFLNFHFTPENLPGLIDQFQPFGINLNGSAESKPGVKDFSTLNDLVSLLEKS